METELRQNKNTETKFRLSLFSLEDIYYSERNDLRVIEVFTYRDLRERRRKEGIEGFFPSSFISRYFKVICIKLV